MTIKDVMAIILHHFTKFSSCYYSTMGSGIVTCFQQLPKLVAFNDPEWHNGRHFASPISVAYVTVVVLDPNCLQ